MAANKDTFPPPSKPPNLWLPRIHQELIASGVLSSAAAVLAALFFSTLFVGRFNLPNRLPTQPLFWGAIGMGLVAFLIVATATGWLAGAVQDYPFLCLS